MPDRVKIGTASGSEYVLVPRDAVLTLDESAARALLDEAAAIGDNDAALEQLSGGDLGDPEDRHARLDALARAIADGRLVAILEDDPTFAFVDTAAETDDWDDLPSLADLRRKVPCTLALELLDHNGLPYADLELQLHGVDGSEQTIVLDERGRWDGRDLAGPGSARVHLPARLELPLSQAKRTPPDGFAARPSDVVVARVPKQPISLALDASYRLVVEPPPVHATLSLPSTLFAAESAFPGPGLAHLVTYAQELTDREPQVSIGIFGHTDLHDDPLENKTLADRRARAAYAVLANDYPSFAEVAEADDWSLADYQSMLRVLGCNPSAIDGEPGTQTDLAVRVFRAAYNANTWHDEGRARAFGDLPEGDALDDATKQAIVDAYHAEIAGRIAPERFLGPRHSGCGEFNPFADADADNRRVTLAIYRDDAPPAESFPCKVGDASACQIDEGGRFRCRFYRERIREQDVERELPPFWGFDWLRTATEKAHLSALTHLPDSNDVVFTVRRARIDPNRDDCGNGPAPRDGLETAVVPGLIRNGVAYALWDFGEDDPFDVAGWFIDLHDTVLHDFAPYFFVIETQGVWGRSDAPSYRLAQLSLSMDSGEYAVGLATSGHIVISAPADLVGAPEKLRVSALRLPQHRTNDFRR